jgi:outer membrane protein TolC
VGTLVGRPPAGVVAELAARPQLPALPNAPDAALAEQMVTRRPDVRAAERRVTAQAAVVGAVRREYLPRLDVVAGVGLTAQAADALGRTGTPRYAVGPVLSWAAFDLGRVRVRVDAARADAAAARAEYEQTVLAAAEEAEGALVAFDRSRARLAYLGEAAAASGRGAELARLRFDGGAADFFEVVDAQRTLLDAEDRLAQGRTDAVTALVALYKALGGEWAEGSARAR